MSMLVRLQNLLRGRRLSRDLDRELQFHLQERTDELVAGGMSPQLARDEARRRFGNVTGQKERTRDADIVTMLDSVAGDVRYAARALGASPGFALVAVLSLGLGIGANTTIFSLINAVMLRQLPVRDPEGLTLVGFAGGSNAYFTNPLWEQIRDGQDVFSEALAYGDARFNLAEAGEERLVDGLWVSGSFFRALGVGAVVGRTLTPGDDVRGCPAVVAVSHAFWQGQLAGDPGVVGRSVRFGGHPFEVVGVIDPRFRGLEQGRAPQFYMPLCADAVVEGKSGFLDHRSWWFMRVLGRPRPGLTVAAVNARLDVTSPAFFANTAPSGWSAENLRDYLGRKLDVRPSLDALSGLRAEYERALWVLMGIVALVLFIACANVANLMLARSAARQRELAVRVALGAGRARILRQLFTEGLLLALAGAALGIALAYQGSHALVGLLSTTRDPVTLDLSVDSAVLGFTMAVAVATAVLFGLAPAWRAMRLDPQAAMKAQGRGIVEGHGRFAPGKLLVAGQVALSLVLVTGAALLLGSFRAMATQDPGFSTDGLLVAEVNLRLPRAELARGIEEQRRLVERLRATPGVQRASSSYHTPMARSTWNDAIQVPGMTFTRPMDAEVMVNQVWDGYFSTLSMRLLAGRDFTSQDRPEAPKVAVINEAAASRFFGGNAVGKTFTLLRGDGTTPPIEVVGVVSDAKYGSLRDPAPPTAYFAMSQDTSFGARVSFVVQGAGGMTALRDQVSRVLAEVAPRASVSFMPLERQVAEHMTRERLLASLSAFFGGLALLLAMIGLYGTISWSVARRRGEFGIRLALGAARSRILGSVLSEVGLVLAAGLVLGIVGVLATTRLLSSFLFGLGSSDPAIIAGSALLLASVSALAGFVPARRASRMDPMATLREE